MRNLLSKKQNYPGVNCSRVFVFQAVGAAAGMRRRIQNMQRGNINKNNALTDNLQNVINMLTAEMVNLLYNVNTTIT